MHSHHIVPVDMGLHTLGLCRLVSEDIQHHSYNRLKGIKSKTLINFSLFSKFNLTQTRTQLTFFTDCVWIPNVTSSTNANCSMVIDTAFSICSTNCCKARVLASLLNTCKVDWTFWIGGTFRFWCWKMIKLKKNSLLKNLFVQKQIQKQLMKSNFNCNRIFYMSHH